MAIPGWRADHAEYRTTAHYSSRLPSTTPVFPFPGGCPPGRTQCVIPGGNWYCADLNTDPFNCGGCCDPCPEGEVCCRGTCKTRARCEIPIPPILIGITGGCPLGQQRCQTAAGCKLCTNTQWDAHNCGGCGHGCAGGEVCCRGSCVVANTDEMCGSDCSRCEAGRRCCVSPTPFTRWRCVDLGTSEHCLDCNDSCLITEECCSSGCTNLDTDHDNCGECGHDCTSRQICRFGECVCPTSLTRCGDTCCEGVEQCCQQTNCCLPNERCCADGSCRDLGTQRDCHACHDDCAGNERCCDGQCSAVDTTAQCGECGRSCGPGEACCVTGSETVDGVTVSRWECTPLGTATDCAACNDACPAPKVCQGGACVCPPNREPCGATCCPAGRRCCGGTCVDTQTSAQHCGDCDDPCAAPKTCQGGSCLCPPGRDPCGSMCCPGGETCCNGACVNLRTSEQHCGACGSPCISGQVCDSRTGVCTPYTPLCENGGCVCPSSHYSCHGWCAVNTFPVCCPGPNPLVGGPYACEAGKRCCSTGSGCCV